MTGLRVPQGFPRKDLGINKGLLLKRKAHGYISALTRAILCGAKEREGEGGKGPAVLRGWGLPQQSNDNPLGESSEPRWQEKPSLSGYLSSGLPLSAEKLNEGLPLKRMGPNNSWQSLRDAPTTKCHMFHWTVLVLYTMLPGPNCICTVCLVLQSWTWSALLCKIHIKPPGPVGLWPGGKIGYKFKDLSTSGFWKGKNQEKPSHNSLSLVPCLTPPWTRSAKKRIREKTWKWCNLASSVDYRLLPLSPWRTAEWFARYQAKTTVQQRAIPRDCFCWVAVFPCLLFKMLITWSM